VRSVQFRVSAAAAVLAFGGLALASGGAAQAAETVTIHLSPGDVVSTSEPLTASGVCINDSKTAVVSVVQGGDVVNQTSVDLGTDMGYSVTLNLAKATTDSATARVDCFKYPDADPLGSAETELFIVDEASFTKIPVTVSPNKVAIGSSFTITAKCPAGSTEAEVLAGSGVNDEPFLDQSVTPAADGTVSLTAVLKAGKFVTVGDAGAVVFCGSEDEAGAIGFAEFTILPAAAKPAVTPAVKPASAKPRLANTGFDNGPLTGMGVALVLLGVGAYRIRRV
jgi:hypothetical protein